MSGYQVLARRWRPQRFEELVGQDVVVRTLRNSLTSGEIAHAYLFSGLRGVGKTTAARLLAKAVNCASGPTAEPCNECAACRDIGAGSAPDVQEIDAASNTGIDNVRELIEVARVLPLRDRYRVFILDEAHQLSSSAFNALLKILEEPPSHVIFVLASTDKQKFPATILSRCQQLDFRPIAGDAIAEHLGMVAEREEFRLSPEAGQLIARAADGSLRDGLSLLDRVRAFAPDGVDEAAVTEVLGLPPVAVLASLWEALAAGDAPRAIALVRQEERVGRDLRALYEQLLELLQALLLLACDPQAPVAFGASVRQALQASAEAVGTPLILRLLGLALEQRALVAAADRPSLAVAVAVGRLALWPRLVRVEALLAGDPAPAAAAPLATGGARGPVAELKAKLAGALEDGGERLLAARLAMAREVVVEGSTLVLRFAGVPAATVSSLREGMDRVVEAAGRIGLPGAIVIENGTTAQESPQGGLRQRVEADDGVRRVLEVFGGRIDSVEEQR